MGYVYVILDLWNIWRQKTYRDFGTKWDSRVQAGVVYKVVEYSDNDDHCVIELGERYMNDSKKVTVKIHRSCIMLAPSRTYADNGDVSGRFMETKYRTRIFNGIWGLYRNMFGFEDPERLHNQAQKVLKAWKDPDQPYYKYRYME